MKEEEERKSACCREMDLQRRLVSGMPRDNAFTKQSDAKWIQARSTVCRTRVTCKLTNNPAQKTYEIWIEIYEEREGLHANKLI